MTQELLAVGFPSSPSSGVGVGQNRGVSQNCGGPGLGVSQNRSRSGADLGSPRLPGGSREIRLSETAADGFGHAGMRNSARKEWICPVLHRLPCSPFFVGLGLELRLFLPWLLVVICYTMVNYANVSDGFRCCSVVSLIPF